MDLVDAQKCRSLEEEIYWKHFGSKYFYLILPDDFHDRLVLPHKFTENMINKLPNKVSLFGPSGASWDVTLSKNNNVAFVGDGWNEFVKAYALKATYLLMFKYKQNKGFEVLIFDPVNLCEKEDGYFVKKPEKPTINSNNHDDQEQKKRSFAQAFGSGTEVLEDENNYDDYESEKRSFGRIKRGKCWGWGKPRRRIFVTHMKAKRVGTSKRNKVGKEKSVMENRESGLELGHSHEPIEIRGKKTGEKHTLVENRESDLELDRSQESSEIRGVKQNGNKGAEELINPESEGNLETAGDKTNGSEPVKERNNSENGRSVLEICSDKAGNIGSRTRSKSKLEADSSMGLVTKEYASKRRVATEKDKENAVQRAEQGLTDDSFIAVMRPSALYNSCYLGIPSYWARKHLPCQSRKVVLRVGDETWPVSFYWHKQRGAWLGGARWREFVSDNHLEEFDVCLVKLASQNGDAVIVFDFDIFRVFPGTVSPTLA